MFPNVNNPATPDAAAGLHRPKPIHRTVTCSHIPWVYRPLPGRPPIVHLDDTLVVVDKPSGLLSVPGRLPEHHDSVQLRLQAEFGRLWVVHRLDMDTSGLIVLARTSDAAADLGRQFERRQIDKAYEALVWGHLPSPSGTINLPLRLDWPHRPRQIVDAHRGKPSLTLYSRLDQPATRSSNQSRLLLHPMTGRSHQLRVHLSAIGHPIVGDRFYGLQADRDSMSASAQDDGRLALHARSLGLRHPGSGQWVHWVSATPF